MFLECLARLLTPHDGLTLINRGDVAGLKHRLGHGLDPNSREHGRVSLLQTAALRLISTKTPITVVNFDTVGAMICLLLSRGANVSDSDGQRAIRVLVSWRAYHKDLVNLAIANGADYTNHWIDDVMLRAAKKECKEGRGRIAQYRGKARACEEEKNFEGAHQWYEKAYELIVQYHQEATEQVPQAHPAIIEAYQYLIDKIDQACKRVAVVAASPRM